MRALPGVLARRPRARVLIAGGDEVSYGIPTPAGPSYRESLLAELGDSLDRSRVHFLGRIPYRKYLSLLRISSAHVYLSYPFVLSWSMLEAMAAGCFVIGSRTPPVEEVIEDGVNGWLVDFFDKDALADRVCDALEAGAALQPLRSAARNTVVERYDLNRIFLPRQVAIACDD
jgi:glycosyltransferase involved in cell wall biosynthesis